MEEKELRSAVTFMQSYFNIALKFKSEKRRLVWYDSILNFLFLGIEPNFAGDEILEPAWIGVFPNLKRSLTGFANGKKGGAPLGSQNAKKDKEIEEEFEQKQHKINLELTQQQPKINLELTQQQPNTVKELELITKTSKLNKLINNKSSNAGDAQACDLDINIFSTYTDVANATRVKERNPQEREPFINIYKDAFSYGLTEDKQKIVYEIIDTLIEANEQSKTPNGLRFGKKTYLGQAFAKLIMNFNVNGFLSVSNTLYSSSDEEIKNRPAYILSAIIQQCELNMFQKERKHHAKNDSQDTF